MSPEQSGALLAATGVAGVGCTITVVVSVDTQLFLVTVSVNVPDSTGNALSTDGFCTVELKEAGPLHCQLTPAESAVADSRSVSAWHIGVLLLA